MDMWTLLGPNYKCPDYQGVFFSFEHSKVSCLGPGDSILFIKVPYFKESTFKGSTVMVLRVMHTMMPAIFMHRYDHTAVINSLSSHLFWHIHTW